MFITFIAFGIIGMIADVAFGALKSLLVERSYELKGSTSLWLFPAYGLISIFYPLIAPHIGMFPWWGRGLVYMAAFYIVQFAVGWGLTKLTICPWRYQDKWSVMGLVYLPYAPVWFVIGLGIEWIWPKVKAISVALG